MLKAVQLWAAVWYVSGTTLERLQKLSKKEIVEVIAENQDYEKRAARLLKQRDEEGREAMRMINADGPIIYGDGQAKFTFSNLSSLSDAEKDRFSGNKGEKHRYLSHKRFPTKLSRIAERLTKVVARLVGGTDSFYVNASVLTSIAALPAVTLSVYEGEFLSKKVLLATRMCIAGWYIAMRIIAGEHSLNTMTDTPVVKLYMKAVDRMMVPVLTEVLAGPLLSNSVFSSNASTVLSGFITLISQYWLTTKESVGLMSKERVAHQRASIQMCVSTVSVIVAMWAMQLPRDMFIVGLYMAARNIELLIRSMGGSMGEVQQNDWVMFLPQAALFVSLVVQNLRQSMKTLPIVLYAILRIWELSQHSRQPVFRNVKNVLVDGIYDMLHIGHADHFARAAKHGDRLYVGINGDEQCVSYKDDVPIYSHEQRLRMAAALKPVFAACPDMPQQISLEFLLKHRIHTHVFGEEYLERWPDADADKYYKLSRKLGIAIPSPRSQGVSTSDLKNNVLVADALKDESSLDKLFTYISGRSSTNSIPQIP